MIIWLCLYITQGSREHCWVPGSKVWAQRDGAEGLLGHQHQSCPYQQLKPFTYVSIALVKLSFSPTIPTPAARSLPLVYLQLVFLHLSSWQNCSLKSSSPDAQQPQPLPVFFFSTKQTASGGTSSPVPSQPCSPSKHLLWPKFCFPWSVTAAGRCQLRTQQHLLQHTASH